MNKANAAVAPRLNYRRRRLANGLEYYTIPAGGSANVAVHVWYQVGSKDDPLGRSGFAHLFEHLMFKATRNMPAEFIDRLTEDVGGYNNASTYDDFTNYYEVVPANHLERILWAEAERMGSLVVNDEGFNAERNVVIEELRERVFTEPYGRLFYLYLAQANYERHPYGRPGIGSIDDLKAATIEDVCAFHTAFYRPDNAVLVISGAFDDNEVDRWVEKYFGAIPAPTKKIPRAEVREPKRQAARTFYAAAPNVPLPAVTISWPGLKASDSQIAELFVLDAILSRGDSSRLFQSAVYDAQIAAEVFTLFEATRDPSAYTIGAIIADGRTPDEGEAVLRAIVAALKERGVSEAELAEAQNEILTEKFQARETADGRAFELADAVSRFGDPAMADKLLDAIAQVSASDVSVLAQHLFRENAETVIRYANESDTMAKSDKIETAPTIAALALEPSASTSSIAVATDRVNPPAPKAIFPITAPHALEHTLKSGLRLIVSPKADVPLISANLRFRATSESVDNIAAEVMVALSMKGTHRRSAIQIAQQIEALGATISTSTTPESSSISLLTRADTRNPAFDIFADIVKNPRFDDAERDRLVRREIDNISMQMSDPASIAARVLKRSLYEGNFGAVATPESLRALTPADILATHASSWRPDQADLVICGDISPEAGFLLGADIFSDWRAPSNQSAGPTTIKCGEPGCLIVDMPEAVQAAIHVGLHGPGRTDERYLSILLATAVLGSGYSARLNDEIRVKRGLSYGAGARLTAYREVGKIVASTQTRNDAAAQVLGLIKEALGKIGAVVAPAEEVIARKAALIGQFGRTIETTAGIASQLANLAFFGIPLARLGEFIREIEHISASDVKAAAAEYFDPQRAMIVIVGNAAEFETDIRAQHPYAEKVSLKELDIRLGSAS